jgi:rare lipoprotein A
MAMSSKHPCPADTHYMNRTRPSPALLCLAIIATIAALLTANLAAEEGLASWYGGHFQGRQTANGEIFDTNQLTAAHKSLPFGTIVQVMHKENGRTVQVRINDRGPFVAGRIIDLSRAAADAIGLTTQGVAPVKLTIIQPGSGPAGLPSRPHHVTIQVASYSSQANARATLERLKAAGLQASLETTTSGVTRVILPEVARTQVAETQKKLAGLGFPRTLVREN